MYVMPILNVASKLRYCEKATKFSQITTLHLTFDTIKSKVEISQNFVAFSEYLNFIKSSTSVLEEIKNLGWIVDAL
jgi:hypothetical protein